MFAVVIQTRSSHSVVPQFELRIDWYSLRGVYLSQQVCFAGLNFELGNVPSPLACFLNEPQVG